MASQINTSNINGAYPIAGQDNDSQGFRDNFTNIRNNFVTTASEISALQDNVVYKSSEFNGQPVVNDMTGVALLGAQTSRFTQSYSDQLATSTINFNSGDLQKVTPTGSITLAFSNWPAATAGYAKIRVWFHITNAAFTVEFPSQVNVGLNKVPGVTGQILTPTVGDYLFEFSTADGGVDTIFVIPLITP